MLITNNTESIVVKYLSIFLKETFNTSVEVTNRYINSKFNAFNNNEIVICNGFCQFALTDINNDNNTLNKIDSLKYYYVYYCASNYKTVDSTITTNFNFTNNANLNTVTKLQLAPTVKDSKTYYPLLVANCILSNFTITVYYKETNEPISEIHKLILNTSDMKSIFELDGQVLEDIDINDFTEDTLKVFIDTLCSILNTYGYGKFDKDLHTISDTNVDYSVNIRYNTDENGQDTPDIIELDINNIVDTQYYDRLVAVFDSTYCRRLSNLSSYIALWLDNRYPNLITDDITNATNYDLIFSNICAYFVNGNIDYNNDKSKYDIDDLVLSFLLGRTISPNSSVDEIAYVQNLFMNIYDTYVPKSLGTWDNALTNIIFNYQRRINIDDTNTAMDNTKINNLQLDKLRLLPTGYFDIYTEKYLLSEQKGDLFNGYNQI
jgi:hypothetical protein